ncbi:1-acyl-sn-glycerol-3-phosphate acyltransferases [Actinopolyspora xinjiangensis]|uniref:1-acyl-sn-glycerol-3-phosphate acyltransferases n=1 Tax=Actinopolyspora xinjiangensis TaxID=405564 RepID=A0A1H0UPD4_9ACTN|nr:lysophospholipid acyltransferase family protein [Actinopolyspora xinjiangensis]SDP67736.1 1-acyl-sn-glycerol-3-phosphate acyltransferases [Actinopolyspora xinjiangensis]
MSGTDAWTPTSPCDTRCLPARHTLPRATLGRRLRRVLAVGVLVACGLLLVPAVPVLPRGVRGGAGRVWFSGLLAAFGVRLRVRGAPPRGIEENVGTLVVSNHVSWLDVLALQAVCPMRMLAKSEVRGWPLIGVLAVRAGTLFIDRDRPSRLPLVVGAVADALRRGHVVGVFPEGTTRCGRRVGRYRSALFQAALDTGAPIHPVALRYRLADGSPTTAAAFVGEDTLLGSLREVLGVRGLVVELVSLPSPRPESVPDTGRPGLPANCRGGSTGPPEPRGGPRTPASTARRRLAARCARATAEVCETRPPENHWTCTAVEVAASCGERSERTRRDECRDRTGTRQVAVGTAVP